MVVTQIYIKSTVTTPKKVFLLWDDRSRRSEGVRSSALDMFYPKASAFDFRRKNMFSDFFRRTFVQRKKKEAFLLVKFDIRNFQQKHRIFFFVGKIFDEKIAEKIFFLRKSKALSLVWNIPKAELLTPPESREILILRNLELKILKIWKKTHFPSKRVTKKKLSYISNLSEELPYTWS